MRIEREHGCCGELEWRVAVPPDVDLEAVADRLEVRGYRPRCRAPQLSVLRHSGRHEIVIVPLTRRVQLRVYLHTPRAARAEVAEYLAADLAACL